MDVDEAPSPSPGPPSRSWVGWQVRAMLANRSVHSLPASGSFSLQSRTVYFLAARHPTKATVVMRVVMPPPPPRSALSSAARLHHDDRDVPVLSKQEQLMHERKRLGASGTTTYHLHAETERLLVPQSGGIVLHDAVQRHTSRLSTDAGRGVAMDAQWSPCGELVSYVCSGDLYVVGRAPNAAAVRLTDAGTRGHVAAAAEFVMQEEFNRYTGYWWAPVTDGDETRHVLYLEVDESNVAEVQIPQVGQRDAADQFRYPRAGKPNATSTLCMATFALGDALQGTSRVTNRVLSPPLSERFPWCEYVVRAGWTPQGSVWAQLLDRKQMHTTVVVFPPSAFVDAALAGTHAGGGGARDHVVVMEESSDYWINITDTMLFLADGGVVWASETTGYRHLYLRPSLASDAVHQLTAGAWQVDDSRIVVDPHAKLLYFVGNRSSPLERHLYCTTYDPALLQDGPWEPQRLTREGMYHNVTMAPDCTAFMAVSSNVHQAPRTTLWYLQPRPHGGTGTGTAAAAATDADGAPVFVHAVLAARVEPCEIAITAPFPVNAPRFFQVTNRDNHVLHGAVFLPPDALTAPARSIPVVLYVYGGPHVQLVVNDYRMTTNMRLQLLASLGCAVVVVDGMGSSRRGLVFECPLKHRMGQFEMDDQVLALDHVLHAYPALDSRRVGLTGSSYGGYLTLMGLAKYPNRFRIAVAGSPVTRWELYDTAYTERYMGLPREQPHAYRLGSVITHAADFPDEDDRLVIVHGLSDENVHFSHTTELIRALVAANKPYRLLAYPQERHGFRQQDALLHFETSFFTAILKELRPLHAAK